MSLAIARRNARFVSSGATRCHARLVGDVGSRDDQVQRVGCRPCSVKSDQPVHVGLAQWYAWRWAEKQVLCEKKLAPALYFFTRDVASSYFAGEKVCWKPESDPWLLSISCGAACVMPAKIGDEWIVCRSSVSLEQRAVFELLPKSWCRGAAAASAPAATAPAAGAPVASAPATGTGRAAASFGLGPRGIAAQARCAPRARASPGLGGGGGVARQTCCGAAGMHSVRLAV